jgi:molecular chaperone GrpE
MQALLPVIDDFDRAMKEIEKEDDDQFKGIKLIHNKLNDTLKSQGLTKINVKEGDKFDADIHEAVTQVPAPKSEMKGKIVDVVEKGYSLGEKILRFPKVVTGK